MVIGLNVTRPRPAVVQPGHRQAGLVGGAHVHHVLVLRPAVAAAGAGAPPADDRQVVGQRVVGRALAAHLRPGVAVIAGRGRQPHGLPHRRLHLGLTDDAHGRGLVDQRLGAVPPAQAAAAIDLPHPLVEHPRIPQRADGGERLPVDLQRPHQVLVAPVGGHPHAEGEALAARIEVGRLPAVLRPRREIVGRAGRHVRLLLVVAVEIAEPEREAAVRVGVPALVHRLHRLPAPVQGLGVRRRAAQPAAGREQPAQQRRRPPGSNPHACPSHATQCPEHPRERRDCQDVVALRRGGGLHRKPHRVHRRCIPQGPALLVGRTCRASRTAVSGSRSDTLDMLRAIRTAATSSRGGSGARQGSPGSGQYHGYPLEPEQRVQGLE